MSKIIKLKRSKKISMLWISSELVSGQQAVQTLRAKNHTLHSSKPTASELG